MSNAVVSTPLTRVERRPGVHSGWYLLAFRSELAEEITPLWVGRRPLIAVRGGDGDGDIRIYDGTCPHRGAHLGVGGRVLRGHVVCPFHGKGIRLGEAPDRRWCVREHETAVIGDAVFARLDPRPEDDRGFLDAVRAATATRTMVEGFVVPVRADPELITENAFDPDHFTAVHEVPKVRGMTSSTGPSGELVIEGIFETKRLPWDTKRSGAGPRGTDQGEEERTRTRFRARAYSPTVVATELGPEEGTHLVITGTVPGREGTVARVAYAVAPADPSQPGGAPSPRLLEPLIAGGRKAFRQDVAVWENLDPDATPRYDARDAPVLDFQAFCRGFGEPA